MVNVRRFGWILAAVLTFGTVMSFGTALHVIGCRTSKADECLGKSLPKCDHGRASQLCCCCHPY